MSNDAETVLDLPLEKQRELAALEGMEFDAWVESTKRELEEADKLFESMRNSTTPPNDNDKRLQIRMDSENPPH